MRRALSIAALLLAGCTHAPAATAPAGDAPDAAERLLIAEAEVCGSEIHRVESAAQGAPSDGAPRALPDPANDPVARELAAIPAAERDCHLCAALQPCTSGVGKNAASSDARILAMSTLGLRGTLSASGLPAGGGPVLAAVWAHHCSCCTPPTAGDTSRVLEACAPLAKRPPLVNIDLDDCGVLEACAAELSQNMSAKDALATSAVKIGDLTGVAVSGGGVLGVALREACRAKWSCAR